MATRYQHTGNYVSWRSPSNIALVKYWGKKGVQLPANASLSMTLHEACTETSVEFLPGKGTFDFSLDGVRQPAFARKIDHYFNLLKDEFDFLGDFHMEILTHNTFPHSAGIASSASAMSALALCLCEIEARQNGSSVDSPEFYRRASHIARLGSGSAARSLFGGMVSWGQSPAIEGSSDEFATPLDFGIAPVFRNMQDTILIIDSGQKKVSSRTGHSLMKDHPFAAARFSQAQTNLRFMLKALRDGDVELFIDLVENEALSLHAMMMTSRPGYMLLHANTLQAMEMVRDFRRRTGTAVCFTLDAGPNVHLLYPEQDKKNVVDFVEGQMKGLCQDDHVIFDMMGQGPKRMIENE